MRHTVLICMLAAGSAACAGRPELGVAPGAQPAPWGAEAGAEETIAGVTVIARPEAWAGVPTDLEEVTPVLVTFENDGDRPIQIRYNEFALVAPTGQQYAAIPPFEVRGTEVEPLSRYGLNSFYVAPYLAPYYPRARIYRGAFPYDPFYYDRFGPRSVRIELPTADMVQKALPEGVLEPGGVVTGFLYFQNVGDDVRSVDLIANIVDARSGEDIGTARIPFVVD